jgi:hypothetical protein
MSKLAKPLAILALALTIAPPALFFLSRLGGGSAISEGLFKGLMLAGTLLWFATAPQWLREDD